MLIIDFDFTGWCNQDLSTTAQEEFLATMHTIVTKKQTIKVKKEEGWYSEGEMKSDLGWLQ